MYARSSNSADPVVHLLGQFLRDLRPAEASYCRAEVTRPWGIGLQFQKGIRFHFVADGSCWVLIEGSEPERLDQGDVVLLPHGTKHVIADDPESAVTDLALLGPRQISGTSYSLNTGGGGARSLIFCCTVDFEEPLADRLIGTMPAKLVLREGPNRTRSLGMLLEVMAAEMAEKSVGSATIMARLADAAISIIVRDWARDSDDHRRGWLAALRDRGLGPALLGIHTRPGENWSLARLARSAAMSRSTFAERFSHVLGVSPARCVLEFRMREAKRLLLDPSLTIPAIAARLGYASEAAFSRAFKRTTGNPPGQLRRLRTASEVRREPRA
ncbi:AraC family transcriptional regulator [Mesorhizobium sp. BHbdii]